MNTMKKATLGAVFAGSLLLTGGVAGTASAATTTQDGLVNVSVGDVSVLNDANIGVVAQICGVKVGPVAVLGAAVDRSGDTTTVCDSAMGPVRIVQN